MTSASAPIPVYVRIVPLDQWFRINIDSASTIAALKDVVLHRAKVGQVARPSRSDRHGQDLPRQQQQQFLQQQQDWSTVTSPARATTILPPVVLPDLHTMYLARKPNPHHLVTGVSSQEIYEARAREILRGDPGHGGPGSLPLFGIGVRSIDRAQSQSSDITSNDSWSTSSALFSSPDPSSPTSSGLASPSSSALRNRKMITRRSSAGGLDGPTRPPLAASASSLHVAASSRASQQSKRSPRLRSSMSSLAMPIAAETSLSSVQQRRSPNQQMIQLKQVIGSLSPKTSTRELENDFVSTQESQGEEKYVGADREEEYGLDAYAYESDALGLLGGNEGALKKESEARLALEQAEKVMRGISMSSQPSARSTLTAGVGPVAKGSIEDANPATKAPTGPQTELLSSTDASVRGRDRSGTIVPSSVTPRAAGDEKVDQVDLMTLTSSSQPHLVASEAIGDDRISRRLAGINRDEISQATASQHPYASYYSLFSYSNGMLLDDFRTIASWKIRPFELLELQHTNPGDRMRIPRRMVSGSTPEAAIFDDTYAHPFAQGYAYIYRPSGSPRAIEKAGVGQWELRWFCLYGHTLRMFQVKPRPAALAHAMSEGGDSAAAVLEASQRSYEIVLLQCNLETISWVGSERADGCTMPAMGGTPSSDIVTLGLRTPPSLPVSTLWPSTASGTTSDRNEYATAVTGKHGLTFSISLRFPTDHEALAWYRIFQRAHIRSKLHEDGGILSLSELVRLGLLSPKSKIPLDDMGSDRVEVVTDHWRQVALRRALIAGRGGVVLPGQLGRQGGRNALARTRLRPHGAEMSVDDADLWSDSDEDEHDEFVTVSAAALSDDSQPRVLSSTQTQSQSRRPMTSAADSTGRTPDADRHGSSSLPTSTASSPAQLAVSPGSSGRFRSRAPSKVSIW